jgi:hypothetical protein
MPARQSKQTSTKPTPDPEVVAEKVATAIKVTTPPASKPKVNPASGQARKQPAKKAAPKVDTTKLAAEAQAKVDEAVAKTKTAAPPSPDLVDITQAKDDDERGRLIARRRKAATAEQKALKAWQAAGAKGTAPATPNLDAVQEQAANGGLPPKAKKGGNGASRESTRSERGKLGVEARSAAGGKQVNPTPIDDDELEAWIRAALKADPDASLYDERPYLRFHENRKVSPDRFAKVFEAIKTGQPVPKATPKPTKAEAEPKAKTPAKAPAKKAAPKQAASKQVTATPNPLKDARRSQKAARAKVRAEAGR